MILSVLIKKDGHIECISIHFPVQGKDFKNSIRKQIHIICHITQTGDGQNSPHFTFTNRYRVSRPEDLITKKIPV